MADPDPDPRSFLPLHPLELRILLVLLEGPAHGYRIVKAIEERESERLTLYPANLYRRIRDLLEKELIRKAGPPTDEEDVDRRRTYFLPTAMGRAVAEAERIRLEELVADARRALGRA